MIYLWRTMGAIILTAVLMGSVMTAEGAEAPPADGAEVVLRVICRADGENPEDGTLTFVLWDEQFNILQRVVNLRDNASFAPLSFFSAGQYVYHITQESGTNLSVVYDPAVYQIVITVMEQEGRLAARVMKVNRVSGDPVGAAEIQETLGAGAIPVFENGTRQAPALPPAAEVPVTGDKTALWQLLYLFSGLGLLWICARCNKTKRQI